VATEVVYLDASAIVKLIADEEESAALRAWLSRWSAATSSELALTEVRRAVDRKRIGRPVTEQAALETAFARVLAGLDLVPLDRALLVAAGELPGAFMGSLDAIHVVSALTLGDAVAAFVTYDERQAEGAAACGLESPARGERLRRR